MRNSGIISTPGCGAMQASAGQISAGCLKDPPYPNDDLQAFRIGVLIQGARLGLTIFRGIVFGVYDYLLKLAGIQLSDAGTALLGAKATQEVLDQKDLYHYAPTFMRDVAARAGTAFSIKGADQASYTLIQILGDLNGKAGRYEYVLGAAGNLTHQLFVEGGTISGVPILP